MLKLPYYIQNYDIKSFAKYVSFQFIFQPSPRMARVGQAAMPGHIECVEAPRSPHSHATPQPDLGRHGRQECELGLVCPIQSHMSSWFQWQGISWLEGKSMVNRAKRHEQKLAGANLESTVGGSWLHAVDRPMEQGQRTKLTPQWKFQIGRSILPACTPALSEPPCKLTRITGWSWNHSVKSEIRKLLSHGSTTSPACCTNVRNSCRSHGPKAWQPGLERHRLAIRGVLVLLRPGRIDGLANADD